MKFTLLMVERLKYCEAICIHIEYSHKELAVIEYEIRYDDIQTHVLITLLVY